MDFHSLVESRREQYISRHFSVRGWLVGGESTFRTFLKWTPHQSSFFRLQKKNGQSRLIHCPCIANGWELKVAIRRRDGEFFSKANTGENREDQSVSQQSYEGLPHVSPEMNDELPCRS